MYDFHEVLSAKVRLHLHPWLRRLSMLATACTNTAQSTIWVSIWPLTFTILWVSTLQVSWYTYRIYFCGVLFHSQLRGSLCQTQDYNAIVRCGYMVWWGFYWKGEQNGSHHSPYDANSPHNWKVPRAICPTVQYDEFLNLLMDVLDHWCEKKVSAGGTHLLDHSDWAIMGKPTDIESKRSDLIWVVPSSPTIQKSQSDSFFKTLVGPGILNGSSPDIADDWNSHQVFVRGVLECNSRSLKGIRLVDVSWC